eukprot:TRINITY_DN39509_c0_g1_i2.p1 TRINITY_DN39509_c0_g1~~TRINITY_DN39509_c0_g1_i2.p1  ORF type:complete len:203 (+),score=16.35 TRINITY_DN39509_c0_g1_i2:170-778(+)
MPSWISTREAAEKPGPGQYTTTRLDQYKGWRKPSYSMGSRISRHRSIGPGPTDYVCGVRRTRQPAYEFGERRKDVDDNGIPGPGTYDVCSSSPAATKQTRPSSAPALVRPASAPQLQRDAAASASTPLLRYAGEETGAATPSWTFGKRRVPFARPKTPGPGRYDLKAGVGLIQKPRYSFQKACRFPPEKPAPGPDLAATQFT